MNMKTLMKRDAKLSKCVNKKYLSSKSAVDLQGYYMTFSTIQMLDLSNLTVCTNSSNYACNTMKNKGKLGKELVEKLDLLLSDRPFTLRAKRKNFIIEDPTHPQGIKRKNFYFDIEMMRINAEKDRIQQFKHIAQTCAKIYYVICKRLSLLNLEEVEHAQYILDYMRNVIESGTSLVWR